MINGRGLQSISRNANKKANATIRIEATAEGFGKDQLELEL